MAKKQRDLTLAEKKRFLKDYYAGRFSASVIENFDKTHSTSVKEIVEMFEWEMNIRKYDISSMTITEIKKMIKNQKKLTDGQISLYEKYSECTFPEVLQIGEERILKFEERKEEIQRCKEVARRYRADMEKVLSIDSLKKLEQVLKIHFKFVQTIQACCDDGSVDGYFFVGFPYCPEPECEEFSKDKELFDRFIASLEVHLKEQFLEAAIIASENEEDEHDPCGSVLHIKVKDRT